MFARKTWFIATGGSACDDVYLEKVVGTEEQVKEYLFGLVCRDKEGDIENWDFGTETVDEIQKKPNGHLYAFGCFSDYHIDYVAILDADITPTILQ